MALGFDYGTSNCSVAQVVNNTVRPVPLVNGETYIPSTLSAPNRESVTEYLYRFLNILPIGEVGEALLSTSTRANWKEGVELMPEDIRFGKQATALYLEDPAHCYYVKSPKSFLGLLGLRDVQLAIFEDLVCAMMANVKHLAEQSLEQDITQVVIGRPINFHNRGGEKSNQQAQKILYQAASRAGFKDIEFQFEPVAAGLEYESTLSDNQIVLVVDVGGGTTDCSMLQMGPTWFGRKDRADSMIAHTGKFIGGNDIDIAIAFRRFMTEFGKGTERLDGKEIPVGYFMDAIAINDVEAQRRFYAHDNLNTLKQLVINAKKPDMVSRLVQVYENTLGYQIVQEAEYTKIALGQMNNTTASVDLTTELLEIPVSVAQMEDAIANSLRSIKTLVQESITQSGVKPDVVYITGGSARSPILRTAIKSILQDTPIVSGDYDGSVTSGLARWADLCFKR